MKYRNNEVNAFMEILENDLDSIVSRSLTNLDVAGVLLRNREDNPEMSMQEAVVWAMRDKAAVVMRKTIALATNLDRITVMVNQMADEMGEDGNQNGERYRERLSVLTDFDAMVKELL
jgi:hypothetical protein